MGPISVTSVVDAPRERVFDFLCDMANRPSFTDQFMHEFHLERIESAGVGAGARFQVHPPGAELWMESVIDEIETPRLIRERGHGGRIDRIPTFTVWELVEDPGPLTHVRLSFWTEPSHPVDRLKEHLGATRWWRRRWGVALRRLAAVLEGDGTIERAGIAGGNRHPTGVR